MKAAPWLCVALFGLLGCQGPGAGLSSAVPLAPNTSPGGARSTPSSQSKQGSAMPLLGLQAPLPVRRLQQAQGPKMWGFEFQGLWQSEQYVTRDEPGRPRIDETTGKVFGWWPARSYTYLVRLNGAHFVAPGLDTLTHLSDHRFVLTVPPNLVWVLTEVIFPEGIKLNGIPLAKIRPNNGTEYARESATERPTPLRIMAGPGQMILITAQTNSVLHGHFDDPAAYGNAFSAGAKYGQ